MPDPVTGAVGASVVGGVLSSRASKKASDASAAGSAAGIAEQRRQAVVNLGLSAPAINTGNVARSQLASILGLDVPGSSFSVDANGRYIPEGAAGAAGASGPTGSGGRPLGFSSWSIRDQMRWKGGQEQANAAPPSAAFTFNSPGSNPMAGADTQKLLENFPGFQFAIEQARKASGAQASAMGSSALGGNVLTALNNNVAGNIAMPVFNDYLNRLTSLSGGAQTASSQASLIGQNGANNISNLLGQQGDARASGIIGQNNALQSGLGDIAQLLGRRNWAGGPGGSVPFTNGSGGNPAGGGRYGP